MQQLKNLFVLVLILTLPRLTFAGEGMWLPMLLKQLNEAEMQGMGMKMSAEDIYSVNRGSLKDAIVHFGGFCTGEVISDHGLVLTNHHCGYGNIQQHTTLENNYLEDGFWAMDRSKELPNPGLFVTFIVRMEDVSAQVLSGLTAGMSERERQSTIDKNINAITTNATKEAGQDVMVRPFFDGNQYFMFVTETFKDIRLVGAPPSSIGKFGADTDNWEWPRHTGDFSLFRIYADKNNRPAEYSPENVPYKPKHFLPISLDGVTEEDFTLIFGFPGRTQEYLPAVAVKQIVDVLNPAKIAIRDRALEIINAAMRANPETRIQYASKQSGIANSWKKWIGESQGLTKTQAISKKQGLEKEFQQRVEANVVWKQQYGLLLREFDKLYKESEPYALARDYYSEIAGRTIGLMQLTSNMSRVVKVYESSGLNGYNARKEQVISFLESFYKDYDAKLDQAIFAALMELYFNNVPADYLGSYAAERVMDAGKNYEQLAQKIYSTTLLTDKDKLIALLRDKPEEAIDLLKKDMAIQFSESLTQPYSEKVQPKLTELNDQISKLQRTYMKALMEVFPEKRFYPDANSTLRVGYGQVAGYEPRDAVYYNPQTYLDGVIEKYQPGDYEFDVPKKLRDLYEAKDYGQYGKDGKMPVCFLGSNHTTGGNSGSPAIDAYGNLVGLNFDRVWEGTMSDYYYDKSICRNIMVDARYILFIIDKFAGAEHLIKEMKLVHPKQDMKEASGSK